MINLVLLNENNEFFAGCIYNCAGEEEYSDFYDIAIYANEHWNGSFTTKEIAENAYNYLRDFEWSKENGKFANSIKVLLTNLDEDIANGEELEYVKYWTSEIRKELDLNQ